MKVIFVAGIFSPCSYSSTLWQLFKWADTEEIFAYVNDPPQGFYLSVSLPLSLSHTHSLSAIVGQLTVIMRFLVN